MEVDGVPGSGPDDWILIAGSDKPDAVRSPFDGSDSYIRSNGKGTKQRFTFGAPSGGDSGKDITKVMLTLCAKQSDPNAVVTISEKPATVNVYLGLDDGITDNSTLIGTFKPSCDWTCDDNLAAWLFYKPWTKFKEAFEWSELGDMYVELESNSNFESDVTLVQVTVDCNPLHEPCPHCCCCCLCFNPTVIFPAGTIVLDYEDGTGVHEMPGLELTVPFGGHSEALQACVFSKLWEDPLPYQIDGGGGKWAVEGITIIGSILEPGVTNCMQVTLTMEFQLPIPGSDPPAWGPPALVTITFNPLLIDCDKDTHLSEGVLGGPGGGSVTVEGSGVLECGVLPLAECGTDPLQVKC